MEEIDALKSPVYKIMGVCPSLSKCYDTSRKDSFVAEIESLYNNNKITADEYKFLLEAASRLTKFNYRLIAEYYANSSMAMQDIMEKLSLVIIDYNKAIEYGYAKVHKSIQQRLNNEK